MFKHNFAQMGKSGFYSAAEERINIYSHALGLLLSVVAFIMLILKSVDTDRGVAYFFSVVTYGVSLITLYSASTFYHKEKDVEKRKRLRIFDHAAIYILIAGTYTPFALVTLPDKIGWWIFAISWSFGLTGIVLKIFFTGRYSLLSTLMYIFMGWMAVFVIKPLMVNLSPDGLFWLTAGGITYTVGAVLYSIKKIPYNHAIFHIFVLIGSACHFVAVYWYV